jgi:hypothetical protein
MSGHWVEATDSDSVESIALRHGFAPATIRDHEENRSLKESRGSMHVLAAGDRVFVPDRESKSVAAKTGRTHTFRRHGVPSRLRLTLDVGDKALSAKDCRIAFPGQTPKELKTDDAGSWT